ncbi:MAG: hypothetical protein ACP5P2_00810 [Candidatus Micrarchaeia archaeon]|jgi:hypothetical protein
MSLVIALMEALLSIIVPGFFLALALLKKTNLSMFEIGVIGFIFGLIFPPTLVWLEGYLIPYFHFFSFSEALYNANVILLTIIGIVLCYQQGVFSTFKAKGKAKEAEEREKDYKERIAEIRKRIKELNLDLSLIKKHEGEEAELERKHKNEEAAISSLAAEEKEKILALHKKEEKELIEMHEAEERLLLESYKESIAKKSEGMQYVWLFVLFLMLLTFATRIANIGVAPRYFEFDPYFDMISTEYILTYGYQLLYDHSAWPTVAQGTIHRIQPIVPYLEAYWYDIANTHPASSTSIDIDLLSLVSGWYPPITAALLVFVVFFFLYHEYGKFPAMIGASLTASMPALVTTFIAGEQLLEPWGIFAMFFFYASYIVAVKYMKEKRFAILAGIAYASTFLGAHYYTVNAGVLAIYIILQGAINVIRGKELKDFYKMNIIVIAVFSIFYALYEPYSATLTERTPAVLGIPVIIAFPLFALIFVVVFDYLSKLYAEKIEKKSTIMAILSLLSLIGAVVIAIEALLGRIKKDIKALSRFSIASFLGFIVLLLIIFTPLGKPIESYIQLSKHFTTPSIPLFMTVQEYEPTGINFNFGAAGFGIIGSSIGGVNIIIWLVLFLFTLLEFLAIFYRHSTTSIMALAAIWPLAVAGMIEVKYLPHFGVGYIIAISAIIGELIIYLQNGYSFKPRSGTYNEKHMKILYGIAIFIVLLEAITFIPIFSAIINPNCSQIISSGNALGYSMFCNTVPGYWLDATSWMRENVGPFGPRILSWWDYGDWINWFGNSNAVLRGDNAVATLDYATAAQYVLGPADGFGVKEMANFMDNVVHAKYLLLDDQLIPKWGALDFQACIYTNMTNMSYAKSQGALVGRPYLLGTSQCEIEHDPVYALIPLNTNNINNFCMLNESQPMVKAILLIGNQVYVNGTYCVPTTLYNTTRPVNLYYANGTKISNAFIVPRSFFYYGNFGISGQPFADFMVLYTPNGPNNTVTNAPSEFYNSNYYRGFFFGELPGFTRVYPRNFTGINYMNSTNPIVIFALNNYTGGLPYVTPKPSWVHNNYTMPG